MQTIAEIMTRDVISVSPQDTVRRAAQIMKETNIGALPVCDGQRLVGMITDRDIAIRAAAAGNEPDDTRIEEVMSEDVLHCFDNQSVDEVLQDMGDLQVRRVPVLDHETQMLIGIVAFADLAQRDVEDTEKTLKEVSAPTERDHRPAM
ncbi:MAG: CBS domain-containing protein [Pseudomonadota bacterium]